MASTRASKSNGYQGVDAMANFLQSPAISNSFLVSQKLALEATRFWARRMRAYADQMEALSQCADPGQMVEAQRSFIERMQEDYVKESSHFAELLSAAKEEERPSRPRAAE